MGDRGISSCLEAILWSRKGIGEESSGAHQTPFALITSFFKGERFIVYGQG